MICVYDNNYEVWKNSFHHNGTSWDVTYQYVGFFKGNYEVTKKSIDLELNKLVEYYHMLSEFALEIEENHWVDYFDKAKEKIKQIKNREDINELLGSIMSPFGGMGSWNDSPPYSAHSKGLEKQFEEYSNNLYNQIHIVLEAVCNKNSSKIL